MEFFKPKENKNKRQQEIIPRTVENSKTQPKKELTAFQKFLGVKNKADDSIKEGHNINITPLKNGILDEYMKSNPSKKALNMIIGFDFSSKQVRILRLFGLDYQNAVVANFSYKGQFLSDEFLVELRKIVDDYLKTLPSSHTLASYLVLPNEVISIDDISLPAMHGKKLESAIQSTILTQYKNYKELQFNTYLQSSNRQYVNVNLTILRKSYLTNLFKALAVNKIYAKAVSYSANCYINSIFQFYPSSRKKSFIFLDIKSDKTNIAICIKGKTYGFAELKLGLVHLKDDKVLQENMQYDHDVADLAIINAKERAKMKTLTIDSDDDMDAVADDVQEQLASSFNKNADPDLSEVLDETNNSNNEKSLQSAVDDIVYSESENEESLRTDEELEENLLQEQVLSEMAKARKKKVFTRKMPKRLPKFMLREIPETPEGFVYENFRMFIKWALLYADKINRKEYLPKLDYILVNMPAQYDYLFDMANSDEENNPIKFIHLKNFVSENIVGNLDLIGALFTGLYNKRQNF